MLPLNELAPWEYVLDLAWLGLRLTGTPHQHYPDPGSQPKYSHERRGASQPGEVARK